MISVLYARSESHCEITGLVNKECYENRNLTTNLCKDNAIFRTSFFLFFLTREWNRLHFIILNQHNASTGWSKKTAKAKSICPR